MRDESMVGVTDTLQLFPDFKALQTGKAKGHLNQPEYIFKNYDQQAGKLIRVTARLSAKQAQNLLRMEILVKLFGEGEKLSVLQMSSRGALMFLIMLVLIRISGRRSFGMRTALDNIIAVSLGAIMSRAVVGASPLIPVVVCCLVIVLLHRAVGRLIAASKKFGRVVEGEKILLFEDGVFLKEHMKRALICEEDLMQGVRKSALTEDMEKIKKVYMERNGEISAIRK